MRCYKAQHSFASAKLSGVWYAYHTIFLLPTRLATVAVVRETFKATPRADRSTTRVRTAT